MFFYSVKLQCVLPEKKDIFIYNNSYSNVVHILIALIVQIMFFITISSSIMESNLELYIEVTCHISLGSLDLEYLLILFWFLMTILSKLQTNYIMKCTSIWVYLMCFYYEIELMQFGWEHYVNGIYLTK